MQSGQGQDFMQALFPIDCLDYGGPPWCHNQQEIVLHISVNLDIVAAVMRAKHVHMNAVDTSS